MYYVGTPSTTEKVKPVFKERYKIKINGTVYGHENMIPVKMKNGKVFEFPKTAITPKYTVIGPNAISENLSAYTCSGTLWETNSNFNHFWNRQHGPSPIMLIVDKQNNNLADYNSLGLDYEPTRFLYDDNSINKDNPSFGESGIDNKGRLWFNDVRGMSIDFNPSNSNFTYEEITIVFKGSYKGEPEDLQFFITDERNNGPYRFYTQFMDNSSIGRGSGMSFKLIPPTSGALPFTVTQVPKINTEESNIFILTVNKNEARLYINYESLGVLSLSNYSITNFICNYRSNTSIGTSSQSGVRQPGCLEYFGVWFGKTLTLEEIKRVLKYG